MPGMKKMPQDKKDYKSKAAMKDGQDTLNTMQPRKGGIYMDRQDGKLPADRVSQYYQDTNPKLEQPQALKNVAEGFKYGGESFMKDLENVGGIINENLIKPVVKAKEQTFGTDFFKDNIVDPVKSELKTIKKKITG